MSKPGKHRILILLALLFIYCLSEILLEKREIGTHFSNGGMQYFDGIDTIDVVAGSNDGDDNVDDDEIENILDNDGNLPNDLDVGDDDNDGSESDGDDEVVDTVSKSATEKSAPSCNKFQYSEKWLKGPRMSNSNETEMSEELALRLIMGGTPRDVNNGSDDALGQTICYEQSRLRNWDPLEEFQNVTSGDNNGDGVGSIQYLTYKLMILAIHENQHRPAKAEALARYGPDKETSCTPENHWGVGKFDFQCDPDTKYIVANLGHRNGLGMVIK